MLCEECVVELEKVKVSVPNSAIGSSTQLRYVYQCLTRHLQDSSCRHNKMYEINDRFTVEFDYRNELYKCSLNHNLVI